MFNDDPKSSKKSLRILKPETTRVLIIGLYNNVTKNSTVIKRNNQKMALLLKIELLLNGPIKRRYCYLK